MKNSNRRSNFFGLFLQSLGTTITDIDDVIFRLAYFERKHHFSLWTDVLQDVQRHYTSQVVKQVRNLGKILGKSGENPEKLVKIRENFERKHHFSLWTDVLQDVQRHYTSQVVKQVTDLNSSCGHN